MSEKNPLENPNVQKFLDFLGKAEGADYNVIVGGKKFDDFSKHPRIVGLRTKEGPSTAAGKYQITKTTYDDFAPKLGITDFSPNSQDRLAVAIFQKEKALADIEKGDFNAAISKLGGRFASLPSSPYSQPKRSQDFVDMQLGMTLGAASAGPSGMQRTAASAKKPQFDVAAGPKRTPAKGKLALSDLPESYRSALALNFLVDSDPEDELMAKATQLLQASMPEQGGGPAGGKVLQQYAAQMPDVSPYQFLQPQPPDPGPAKMAEGGLAIGGTRVPFVPNPSLTKEQMDLIKQRDQEYEGYQQRFKDYETSFSEYEKQAAAYDAAIEEHNRTLASEFTMQAPVAPTAPSVGFDTAEYEKTMEQAQKDAALRSQALGVALDPRRFNLSGLSMFKAGGEVNSNEVTGDDLFQQMITGRAVEPVVEPIVMPRPMQSEVPSMDRLTGGVMRDPQQVKPQRSVLQEMIGGIEAGATIATGIPAMVPAAAKGVMGFLTPGEKLADTGKAMTDVAQRLTYMPKGEAGQENLENLGQFLQATKLDGMLPQVQLMRPLVAPGAVGILRQQAKDAMDARGGPDGAPPMSGMGLQPAMATMGQGPVDRTAADRPLVRPAESVAVPSITQAVRPGGGDVYTDSGYDISGLQRKTKQNLMDTMYDEEIETQNLAIGQLDAIQKDPFIDTTDKYQLGLEQRMFADSPFAKYQEAFNFIESPLFLKKINNYVAVQYGSPNDPLYKAYMQGRYDVSPALQDLFKDSAGNRGVEKIIKLKKRRGELLDPSKNSNDQSERDLRNQELGQIENDLTAAYDALTPFKLNMTAGTLGARLQNDTYRADLVYRMIDIERGVAADAESVIGKGYLDKFNKKLKDTNAEDMLDERLKQLGVYLSTNATDNLENRAHVLHDVFLTKKYGIDLSYLTEGAPTWSEKQNQYARLKYADRFKKMLDQQLIDEIQFKVEDEGGIYTGKGLSSRGGLSFGVLENLGASERGKATLQTDRGVTPIDFSEVVEYLAKTPRKDYENKTFPEIVLAAHSSNFYKDIKNPVKIAQRADRYQALTTEQRFTGTVPWREDLSQDYFNAMKSSSLKGAQWREINTRGGIKVEGRLLRHCLSLDPTKKSSYERKLEQGESRFFTLKDKQGKSYATIEITPSGKYYNVVNQIRGKGNSPVGDKFAKEIEAFLDEYKKRELGGGNNREELFFNDEYEFIPPKYRPVK